MDFVKNCGEYNMGIKVFTNRSCYAAAQERAAFVFDKFENISVSISGGKDSTVLYWLVVREAARRNRKVRVFFLDQEAEYQASIDLINKLMVHPNVIPEWYQVPIRMTNATSYNQEFLYAWGEGEEWMRQKSEIAIKSLSRKYPKRFYDFFYWKESQENNTAFFVGIRAEESINRFRAVTKKAGYEDILWSTQAKSNETSYRFYPIYDWGMGDVWKYINDNGFEYNTIYDKMFSANHSYYNQMRVSNLVHEKSFACIKDLQKLEPETYHKLLNRLRGVHCAARYAGRDGIYNAESLPPTFENWLQYRNYLLETTPYVRKERFIKRFSGQQENEHTYKQQVKQLLINDWENNVPVNKKVVRQQELKDKWYDLL